MQTKVNNTLRVDLTRKTPDEVTLLLYNLLLTLHKKGRHVKMRKFKK